jgi:DNA polymerase-3 subunit delta
MPQTAEAILKDLHKGRYAPVYFLQGEEPFYIDQIANYIEKNALSEADKGFNQVVCYGKDLQTGTLMNHARRFPMMANRQVVIVKEAQEIQDLGKEESQKLLENYVTNPLPSTILVLCHKYKSLDGRKALAKALDKHAVLVDSKKLYDNQLPDWVASYCREKGFKVSAKATVMLAESVGNDLSRIAGEIDKMLINLTDGGEITADTVQKFVGISKEYNTFELQKALTQRDVMKANQIIHYFESNPKDNPIIPVIALLFSFFCKVLVAYHTSDKSENNLATVLKVNRFFVKDYLQMMRAYPFEKVIHIIHFLKEADLKSKGVDCGSATDHQILKELVFKILH